MRRDSFVLVFLKTAKSREIERENITFHNLPFKVRRNKIKTRDTWTTQTRSHGQLLFSVNGIRRSLI
jgi:hypothetical protein